MKGRKEKAGREERASERWSKREEEMVEMKEKGERQRKEEQTSGEKREDRERERERERGGGDGGWRVSKQNIFSVYLLFMTGVQIFIHISTSLRSR